MKMPKMPPLPIRHDVHPLLGTVLSIPNAGFDKRWNQAIKNNASYYKSLQRMTKEELIEHHVKSWIHSLMTGKPGKPCKPGFQRLRTSHMPVRVLASKRGVNRRQEIRDGWRSGFIEYSKSYFLKHPGARITKVIASFRREPGNQNAPIKDDTYYGYRKKNTR